ncbi:heme ABC transporter permease CcmC [Candidatus Odyssella acanthamoebae]|uniref:heme ABC transporter permease CcmC n=1 Tax=Candidatus Odyssella acanthamoebae TaxID=91604 RepID=UPI00056F6A2D|nr:heme ABC transporter permease CcmC [Candidatus Paracaedibacter acanthamoebae]
MIKHFISPAYLLHISHTWLQSSAIIAFALLSVGLWLGLAWSPADYVQGETVRIMYIHVPAAWGAMLTYFGMAILSLYAFLRQNPTAHILTRSMASIGFCLCIVSLVTGAIWGKPTWGTWWVWDARLTSMLILAFLYAGYIITTSYVKPEQQALKISAILAIIGSINLPIIKWSVDWWYTLHQPASILRLAKPAIHWQMLVPLLIMALGMAALCFCLFLMQLRTYLVQQKVISALLRRTSS